MQKILEFILNLLVPANKTAQQLELMNLDDLLQTIQKSKDEGEWIVSCLNYRDPLAKELVWQIKFKHNRKLALLAANLLYDTILSFMSDVGHVSGFDRLLIIPVPISTQRRRQRGYNQSEILVQHIMEQDEGVNFQSDISSVKKIKDTKPQTSLSRSERGKNLIGCFSVVKPKSVKDRDIILIDDVYTTGSTLKELKRILISAGAKKVMGFTIAH